jgi:hypothetical protein
MQVPVLIAALVLLPVRLAPSAPNKVYLQKSLSCKGQAFFIIPEFIFFMAGSFWINGGLTVF